MKGKQSTASLLLLGCISIPALAQDPADLPPPPLGAYIAQPTPPVPVQERVAYVLQGFYISGKIGNSWISANDIENVTENNAQNNNAVLPPPGKTDFSETKFIPSFTLGYQLVNLNNFITNIEVNYTQRNNLKYNASPFLVFPQPPITTSQINSKIDNQTILVNLVEDFAFERIHPLVPYIQAGIGAARNSVSGNAQISFDIAPGFIPPFVFNGTVDNSSQTDLAWDAGIGLKFALTPNFYLSLGYEYDSLGSLEWNVDFPNDADTTNTPLTVKLQSDSFHSNNILAGITWIPFPKENLLADSNDP